MRIGPAAYRFALAALIASACVCACMQTAGRNRVASEDYLDAASLRADRAELSARME